jgi:hypothetical protein
MSPPKLSYGLNVPKSKQHQNRPLSLGKPNLAAGQKRKKTIFDSDSEGDQGEKRDGGIEIVSFGGLERPSPPRIGQSGISKDAINTGPALRKGASGNAAIVPPHVKKPKGSIFADDDDDDDDDDDEEDSHRTEVNTENSTQKHSKPRFTGTSKDYTNLAALHSSNKHSQASQEIDPSIYSYDTIYDSIHVKRDKALKNDGDEGSRYIDALLRSADVRKRDQVRARDRLLAREREAEGDEFADKEKFVTAAYRAQQEEIRKMEEEEAKREREEEERRKRNGGTGMVELYRDMLAREEEQHGAVMKATEDATRKAGAGEAATAGLEADIEKEKTEAEIAAELNAKGANIVLNDEGQVVDKRQLLSAGLNVAPKNPSASVSAGTSSGLRPGAKPGPSSNVPLSRNAQRARQTEMLATQLEERARQEEEAEAARQREIAERNRSHKTEGEVSSARERYLARKREREAVAAKEKERAG